MSALFFSHEIAYLKQLHPDWHLAKIVFSASWNVLTGQLHTMLDLVGLVPGLGEGADFINGVFYILEGDKANATYSFLAMGPEKNKMEISGELFCCQARRENRP